MTTTMTTTTTVCSTQKGDAGRVKRGEYIKKLKNRWPNIY